ncbi:hypothetical protein [Peribacillus loiseleuriae]|uniref:hypothetical protein n=1 Tax=Peribacillus loiseleuriae TaxID=1679170 RepID=UPI003D070483
MGQSLSHKVLNQRLVKLANYIDEYEVENKYDAATKTGLEMALAKLEGRPFVPIEFDKKNRFSIKKWLNSMKWRFRNEKQHNGNR